MFTQQLVNGLTLGVIYALVAVGYSLVYGVIELINFAHGEVFMVGAFVCVSLIVGLGLPLFPALVLAMLAAALLGMLIERLAYRPLRRAPRLSALITAIGVSIVLQNLAMIVWGASPRPFPQQAIPAFLNDTALQVAGVRVSGLQLFILATAVAMAVFLTVLVQKTRFGRAMRALAQNMTAAELMGVDIDRIVSATFALGSALGAVAGVLVAMYYNTLSPTMGYSVGIKAFAAAVLGGIGSLPGAMVGGVLLGVAETLGAGYLSSDYRDGVAYLVMIAIILLRPNGLFGQTVAQKA